MCARYAALRKHHTIQRKQKLKENTTIIEHRICTKLCISTSKYVQKFSKRLKNNDIAIEGLLQKELTPILLQVAVKNRAKFIKKKLIPTAGLSSILSRCSKITYVFIDHFCFFLES